MEEKFGNWTVSAKGDMTFEKGSKFYYIDAKRIKNWHECISHMFSKPWCDWNDFIPAYWYAMGRAGVKSTQITVYNNDTPIRTNLIAHEYM